MVSSSDSTANPLTCPTRLPPTETTECIAQDRLMVFLLRIRQRAESARPALDERARHRPPRLAGPVVGLLRQIDHLPAVGYRALGIFHTSVRPMLDDAGTRLSNGRNPFDRISVVVSRAYSRVLSSSRGSSSSNG